MAFAGERDSGYVDKLVNIGRVAKVVKGGRRFTFSAIVVVGDESGRVGWGSGKAREVPEAVRKATDVAKKRMVRVPMREARTIHHHVYGEFGGSKVFLKPATPGTGIIAGGPMRAVFESMGMKDVVAKSLGSNNPYNMIQATFDAFEKMQTPRSVAAKRGLKMSDLRDRRINAGFTPAKQPAEESKKAANTPKSAPKTEAKDNKKATAKDTKKAAASKGAAQKEATAAQKAAAKKSTGTKKSTESKTASAKTKKAADKESK